MVINNLANKHELIFTYTAIHLIPEAGISQPLAKPAITNATASTVCGYWTVYYWSTSCTTSSSTTEPRVFGTPTYSRPDGASSHGSCQYPASIERPTCTSMSWALTESTSIYQCQTTNDGVDEFTPPPPLAPYIPPTSISPLNPNYVALIQSTLLSNPDALMLPCAGLTNAWLPIIQFRPAQSVRDKPDYLSSRGFIVEMGQSIMCRI